MDHLRCEDFQSGFAFLLRWDSADRFCGLWRKLLSEDSFKLLQTFCGFEGRRKFLCLFGSSALIFSHPRISEDGPPRTGRPQCHHSRVEKRIVKGNHRARRPKMAAQHESAAEEVAPRITDE